MGYSPKIVKLAEEVEKVAPTDIGVLIIGETGVGKEVVAQAIHSQSTRSEGEFVAMDCGAIPETLFESELFGHEKGAFTGANTRKIGKFEAAQNGTLFLDEITNIPLGMQSKFLRVLQEKTFFRIGSSKKMKANVRIIAATNKEFKRPSDWDEFRTDLYYRLAEYVLYVPALRERKEDILYLVKKFYRQANSELGKNVLGISEDALDYLFDHDWPGNVRELNNVIKRAVLLADEMIEKEHLGILDGDTSRRDTFAEQAAIEEVGDTPRLMPRAGPCRSA
ncbi:MAG: sigma-54 dependent transcriptional regulator [Planctomycetota bacterium]|nr:sigma-54 dependent transcriptional regulator [Planctomycetota bacterium]